MKRAWFVLCLIPAVILGCKVGDAPELHTQRTDQEAGWRYALVIDASSSASTLHIYRWQPGAEGSLPRIEEAPYPRDEGVEDWTMSVHPGLSAYAGRPADGARSLEPLIEYARQVIPAPDRADATLHLWATGGLRELAKEQRSEILDAVAGFLGDTVFDATEPRVIRGREEGVYGWLEINYLLGRLDYEAGLPTVGVLDLGGASAQISFVPLDAPRENFQVVAIGGQIHRLYTHSYLGMGQDDVRETLAEPACFPAGYPSSNGAAGAGDLTACRQAIRERLAKPCVEGPCSLFGVYQPPVRGDFVALSVYAYTADFFELGGTLQPAELEAVGSEFCSTSWAEHLRRDPSFEDDPHAPNYCFTAAYIVELLTEGFGFSAATEEIEAPLTIRGTTAGWTLGALLFELAGDSDDVTGDSP